MAVGNVVYPPKEFLTKKDVVDNLVGDTGYLPLSDKQGKILNEKMMNFSNPNLLINSCLANPINQRGQNIYNTNNEYSIDRWLGLYTDVILNEGYTRITGVNLRQYIENANRFAGKYVTFSTLIKNFSGSGYIYINDGFGEAQSRFSNGVVTCTAFIHENSSKMFVGFFGECEYLDVCWVKLELGSIATPFVPPDPATELLKCQRYYQTLNGQFRKTNTGLSHVDATTLNYIVPMRVPPRISDSSSVLAGIKSYTLEEVTTKKLTLVHTVNENTVVQMYYNLGLDAEIY